MRSFRGAFTRKSQRWHRSRRASDGSANAITLEEPIPVVHACSVGMNDHTAWVADGVCPLQEGRRANCGIKMRVEIVALPHLVCA